MQVGYLIEYRRPAATTGKRAKQYSWLAIGVVRAPAEITPADTLDRIRGEYPQLHDYEVRVRYFHPLPGCRLLGDTANVLVIESAIAPVVPQNVREKDLGDPDIDPVYYVDPTGKLIGRPITVS